MPDGFCNGAQSVPVLKTGSFDFLFCRATVPMVSSFSSRSNSLTRKVSLMGMDPWDCDRCNFTKKDFRPGKCGVEGAFRRGAVHWERGD